MLSCQYLSEWSLAFQVVPNTAKIAQDLPMQQLLLTMARGQWQSNSVSFGLLGIRAGRLNICVTFTEV